ncbi:MAG: SH3-like domain-containing protein [Bacteroidales bacterium]|nr:SH3-like domain-containing protein [Bacteroidales bacterium]
MRLFIFASIITTMITACNSGENSGASARGISDLHKVKVKEVLQTSNYTYLLVSEIDVDNWLALPKMQAIPGEIYYYRNGFKMTDFESKELGRKFETIYFLESLSTTPDFDPPKPMANPHASMPVVADTSSHVQYTAQVVVKKEEVDVDPAEQGLTIAELIANKGKYDGKTIRVKGKVTKFNAKIMKHNWIHIQDGTEYSGKFDLTATTDIEVAVGETITLEGKVALDKDFGYGYSYEILLEDSKLIK